jgi:membrane associated rhomboid family serine protease
MNRTLQGILSIFLGFLMLAWFVYSIMNPPTRPSETYAMDWVLVFVRLIGAIAGLVGGVLMLVRK